MEPCSCGQPSGCGAISSTSTSKATTPLNSGTKARGLISPKASVVLGPWSGTELYVNTGVGFHSNDARGATTTRDPGTGQAVDPTTSARACEAARRFGVRTVRIPKVQTTVAVWAARHRLGAAVHWRCRHDRSRRGQAAASGLNGPHMHGRDRGSRSTPTSAISRGRFTDEDPAGDRIPGSVESVIALGASLDSARRIFGSVRVRHFGARSLVEDDSSSFGGDNPCERTGRSASARPRERRASTSSICSTSMRATSTISTPRGCAASLQMEWTTSTRIRRFRALPASPCDSGSADLASDRLHLSSSQEFRRSGACVLLQEFSLIS